MTSMPSSSSPPVERQPDMLHRLEALIMPVVQGLGLKLWGVEYFPVGRKALVRIYIDAEDGVSVDQCAQVSRQLSPALDIDEALPGLFTLEVSSPGLERIFFRPEQLVDYVGHTVQVKLNEPQDDRASFRGTLDHVEEMQITLDENGLKTQLPWNQIKKIHLVYLFDQKTS